MLLRLLSFLRGKSDRHPRWASVRKDHLRREPACAACGGSRKLEVHHILPVSAPGGRERELDPDNLITLCEPHHALFGHFMDYCSWNPSVREDATHWRERIRNRPRI